VIAFAPYADPTESRLQWRRHRRDAGASSALGVGDIAPIVAGGAVALAPPRTALQTVAMGVATGVGVWMVTRVLDRILGGSRAPLAGCAGSCGCDSCGGR